MHEGEDYRKSERERCWRIATIAIFGEKGIIIAAKTRLNESDTNLIKISTVYLTWESYAKSTVRSHRLHYEDSIIPSLADINEYIIIYILQSQMLFYILNIYFIIYLRNVLKIFFSFILKIVFLMFRRFWKFLNIFITIFFFK